MNIISYNKKKELALITAIIINEDILGGTVFQKFDTAYRIAEKFYKEYSKDTNWEKQQLDYDEAIIQFIKTNYNK